MLERPATFRSFNQILDLNGYLNRMASQMRLRRLAVASIALGICCLLQSEALFAADYGLSGKWRGTWTSQTNGHHGPLKAKFRPQSDGSVRAVFTGRFAVVMPFRYTMKLQPSVAHDGSVCLSGSKKLGPILGSYDFSARANAGTLNASYSAGRDQGNFSLRRSR